MRRVVVTGIGIVPCLGNNQKEVNESLLNSKSGKSYAEEYKEHNLKSQVHGKPNIKLEDHVERKTKRVMGTGSANNKIAMKEAVEDSG
jgi:3-oxoacyl-(acyl-carrier-protein) synthase